MAGRFSINSKSIRKERIGHLDCSRGVDMASIPTNVARNRAVEIKNLVNRDGINRKRYGWKTESLYNGDLLGVWDVVVEGVDFNILIYSTNKNQNKIDVIEIRKRNNLIIKKEINEILEGEVKVVLNRIKTQNFGNVNENGEFFYDVNNELKSGDEQDVVFIIGRGYFLCFDGKYKILNNNIEYDGLKDIKEYAYIPTIIINKGWVGKKDVQSSFEQVNSLIDKVQYTFETPSEINNNNWTETGTPYVEYQFDKKIVEINENNKNDIKIIINNQNVVIGGTQNINLGYVQSPNNTNIYKQIWAGNYVNYIYNNEGIATTKKSALRVLDKYRYNENVLNYLPNKYRDSYMKFSNGYKIKFNENWGSTKVDLVLVDDGDNIITTIATFTCSAENLNRIYKLNGTLNKDVKNLSLKLNDNFDGRYLDLTSLPDDWVYVEEETLCITSGFEIEAKGAVNIKDIAYNTGLQLSIGEKEIGILNLQNLIMQIKADELVVNNVADFSNGAIRLPIKKELTKDYIKKCSFGNIFGVEGLSDTLFLSGNNSAPNEVYWSYGNDFTYFPDNNFAQLGNPNAKVVGFQKLSDSTLAVYKEQYMDDQNLYIVNGRLRTKYNDNGTLKKSWEEYTFKGSLLPVSPCSYNAFGQLGSDNVFVSDKGIFGLSISDTISANRYAKERSMPIDSFIRGLEYVSSISYDNKLYVSYRRRLDEYKDSDLINNYDYDEIEINSVFYDKYQIVNEDDMATYYKYYVVTTDSKYRYSLDENLDDTFNYEWWILENIPANRFVLLNDGIKFTTRYGALCSLKDEKTDISIRYIDEWMVKGDTKITQYTVGEEVIKEDGLTKFVMNDEKKDRFDNAKYLIVNGNKYCIESKEGYYLIYSYNEDEEKTDILDIDINSLNVTTIEHEGGLNETVDMPNYQIIFEAPVHAYWKTKVFDCNYEFKTKKLFNTFVALDSNTSGDINLQIYTKSASRRDNFQQQVVGTGAVVTGARNYVNGEPDGVVSFVYDTQSTYGISTKIRNFNYIQFVLESNTADEFAIVGIDFIYTLLENIRGVK